MKLRVCVKALKRVVKFSTKKTYDDAANLKSSCEHSKTRIPSIVFSLFSMHSFYINISIKYACVLAEDIIFCHLVPIISCHSYNRLAPVPVDKRNLTTKKFFSKNACVLNGCVVAQVMHRKSKM